MERNSPHDDKARTGVSVLVLTIGLIGGWVVLWMALAWLYSPGLLALPSREGVVSPPERAG